MWAGPSGPSIGLASLEWHEPLIRKVGIYRDELGFSVQGSCHSSHLAGVLRGRD